MQIASIGEAYYFVTFADDFSQYTKVYFMKTKDEVTSKFIKFKALVENQMGKKIKILRSNNGRDYVNCDLENILKANSIRYETTVPFTPEQTGVAERTNWTLVEGARSMLIESNLSSDYWAEAVSTSAYLRNRSPTVAVNGMTPEEAWTGNKPDLSHLRVLGCKALVHVPKHKRSKSDAKAQEYVFFDYCEDSKRY